MKVKSPTVMHRAAIIVLGLLPSMFLSSPSAVMPARSVMAQDQESSASLGETMDWIRAKLDKHFFQIPGREYYVSISVESVQGCQLRYVETTKGSTGKNSFDITRFAMSLDKLDPFGSKLVDEMGGVALHLNSPVKKPAGTVTYLECNRPEFPDTCPVLKTPLGEDQFPFYFSISDKDLAKRMQRAFDHAIKLCGGKTEPF